MKIQAFFVACALFVTSALSAQPTVVPHCSPNCEACPSCEFCDQNCTLTQGYWKNHTECWPAAFDPGTTKLCNILWIDIFNTPVKGRPWYSLAHQWMAAMLNQANGADTSCIDCSGCIEGCTDALAAAGQLLTDNCANIDDKTPNAVFQCFVMLLDDYNMGMIDGCPAHCGGSNPCQTCDCGLCCPQDCNLCVDCPNLCDLCLEADCPTKCCPNPCQECPSCPACPACPACICTVENGCCSSSSSSSTKCSHKHKHHRKKATPVKKQGHNAPRKQQARNNAPRKQLRNNSPRRQKRHNSPQKQQEQKRRS